MDHNGVEVEIEYICELRMDLPLEYDLEREYDDLFYWPLDDQLYGNISTVVEMLREDLDKMLDWAQGEG